MALIEHLEKLRHFYRISRYSSVNVAATMSGISQSGLSKSLSLLEAELGCALFHRSKQGLTLTPEGQDVLEFTTHIFEQATALENRLQSLHTSSAPEQIRIGMYDSIAVYFGLPLQTYLNSIYPNVTLVLEINSSQALLNKMETNDLDFAFGVNFSNCKESLLKYFHLFDDYFSFYIAPSSKGSVDKLPILIHANPGIPNPKELKRGLKGRVFHTIHNFETLKILTTLGLGIGILPTQVARPLVAKGQLENIQLLQKKSLFSPHQIGFLVRSQIAETHKKFTNDILRLSERWAKT